MPDLPDDVPLRITPEQARTAIRALGIQDHLGVFEVTIAIDEVTLKRTAYDEDGEPIMCRGGLTNQTIHVPVKESR
jgi:hypothetical protein